MSTLTKLQEEYDKWARIARDNEGTEEGKRAAQKLHDNVIQQIVEQEKQKAEAK